MDPLTIGILANAGINLGILVLKVVKRAISKKRRFNCFKGVVELDQEDLQYIESKLEETINILKEKNYEKLDEGFILQVLKNKK